VIVGRGLDAANVPPKSFLAFGEDIFAVWKARNVFFILAVSKRAADLKDLPEGAA